MSSSEEIFNLPLSDRRYIAILSDGDFDRKKSSITGNIYKDIMMDVLPIVVPGAGIVKLASVMVSRFSKGAMARPVSSEKDNVRGGIILAIPQREADKFTFLGGCAEIGKAYAANPLNDRTYYSVDTYNDDMIDHKLSELERILNGLGAKKYEIIFDSDEQIDASGIFKGRRAAQVKAELELKNFRAKRFERSGTSFGCDPVLPENLVWLDREPSWKALVESRMKHGRKEFKLRVNLERDLQLSSSINADLKVLGIDIGADFKRKMNFTLSVQGTFSE